MSRNAEESKNRRPHILGRLNTYTNSVYQVLLLFLRAGDEATHSTCSMTAVISFVLVDSKSTSSSFFFFFFPPSSPVGEVWEANMEQTGGGCEGPCGRQQLCSGPENS